jgi:hypothetical protein
MDGERTPTDNQYGIKITRRWDSRNSVGDLGDSSYAQIFYIQGEWRRLEQSPTWRVDRKADGSTARVYGPRIVSIVRTDLRQMFELNLDTSEYTQMPFPPNQKLEPLTKEELEARGIKMPLPGEAVKPTFRIETRTRDTGERKQMFGYLARHVITTRKEIPFEGSGRLAQERIKDGWYIDLEPKFYPSLYPLPSLNAQGKSAKSDHSYLSGNSNLSGNSKVPEKPEFVDIGEPENGFALQELLTSRVLKFPDGSTRQTEHTAETVVTLEKGTYDLALFEVPSGFKRVRQINRNPA